MAPHGAGQMDELQQLTAEDLLGKHSCPSAKLIQTTDARLHHQRRRQHLRLDKRPAQAAQRLCICPCQDLLAAGHPGRHLVQPLLPPVLLLLQDGRQSEASGVRAVGAASRVQQLPAAGSLKHESLWWPHPRACTPKHTNTQCADLLLLTAC